MLWWKAWHIIAIVAWFAGLFYLPRLFVYHAETKDELSLQRFKIMERRLYYGIMWPAAILVTIFGFAVLSYASEYYLQASWFRWKLSMVVLLWGYHLLCGRYLKRFANSQNQASSRFFRAFNEIPTIILIVVVILVVVKP